MEYRNPRYNSKGTIDVEINHPTLGWIFFTADPNDVEEFGQLLFEELKDEAEPYVSTLHIL